MMKTMNDRTLENFEKRSECERKHMAELVYMALEITEFDIKKNGGYNSDLYKEIEEMHNNKLLASNKHRQYAGHITAYWLTKKGFKALNKNHEIC